MASFFDCGLRTASDRQSFAMLSGGEESGRMYDKCCPTNDEILWMRPQNGELADG